MKKAKSMIALLALVVVVFTGLSTEAYGDQDLDSSAGTYTYTFNIKVDNPCNSKEMDKDAVNTLYFEYHYNGQNGFAKESAQKYDLSWNGSNNRNASFLKEHFVRANDNSYNTSFQVTLDGKLNKTYIKLNMDGGERLSFTVESIYCNGKRINSNTDYVSSAYFDSTANIYCSMEESVIDEENSPYFQEHDEFLTETEMKQVLSGLDESYDGQFKDQYNAVIDSAVLEKCVESSDGQINQYYSHKDEESMYKYTFYYDVENPINLEDADYDEVETFYLEITYKDQNGYGENKKYTLDMSYDDSLKRNLNQTFLEHFQAYNDEEYEGQFSLWVPGIITQVDAKLNMSGEKLVVNFEKITLGSLAVNTSRDYVSSTYFDSDATVTCFAAPAQIVTNSENLSEAKALELRDQYGAMVSDKLLNLAKEDETRYRYHK